LKTVTDSESGSTKCAFILDPELILTMPVRRRPHQGWRYFETHSAPPDLGTSLQEYADMPPEMMADLRSLGLI
jgi:hypothetical protein